MEGSRVSPSDSVGIPWVTAGSRGEIYYLAAGYRRSPRVQVGHRGLLCKTPSSQGFPWKPPFFHGFPWGLVGSRGNFLFNRGFS